MGVPLAEDVRRGGLGNSETRNLEFGGPLGSEPDRGPRKLGNSESGIWGWARTQEGASETRKLGIWNVCPSRPDPRGGLGNSETRNLEFGGPLGSDPRGGLGNSETRNLEFAREYPGICTLGTSWNLEFAEHRSILESAHAKNNKEFGNWVPSADLPRGLGILETRNLEFAREYPGICTLGILESGICGGVSWNLPTRKQGIWKLGSLRGPTEGPWNLGNSETRNLEFAEEYLGICTLGNMKSGFWGPSADPRRGTGNSEIWNLEFGFPCCKVAPPPPPPRALGYRSSLPGTSPPWSTVGQPLIVNGHLS